MDDASLELVAEGRSLADRLGASLSAVLLGDDLAPLVAQLSEQGANNVYLFRHPSLAGGHPDLCLPALAHAVRGRSPDILLFPAQRPLHLLAARLAARLGVALASGCIKLDLDAEGRLQVTRPVYNGRLAAKTVCTARPQVATFEAGYGRRRGSPCATTAIEVEVSPPEATHLTSFVRSYRDPPAEMDLNDAEVVVAGGRGVGGREGFRLLEELADRLGGTVAASRVAVDAGWVPSHRQIGLSGKTVMPRLYIACGISGSVHHVVGMKDSKSVIAINTDRNAPIFKLADVGIVGDVLEVVPRLLERLKARGAGPGAEVTRAFQAF